MNRYTFLLGCILSFSQAGYAQKNVLNYETIKPTGKIKGDYYESFVATNKAAKQTTIVLKNKENAEYILLNKDAAVEAKVIPGNGLDNTVFKADWYLYLGSSVNKKGSNFIYSVKDKNLNSGRYHIRVETVDFNAKTVINQQVFEIPGDERTMDFYTNDQSFCLVTCKDKSSELVFYILDENNQLNKKSVTIDLDGYNREKLSLSEYFSYSHVFQPGEETELIASTDLNKIYVYPDKLVMIVTNYKEPPHIWEIDTHSFKATKRKLNLEGFAGFSGKKEKFYNNSYLYKDHLFVLNTSKNKIEIGVFDYESGKLLKKHEINESSDFNFPETPVEITVKGRFSHENTITSAKELIKEISKGSTGIAIAKNKSGQLVLTCGVYDKEQRASAGTYSGGFGPASMPAGGTYAGSNVPITRTYSNFNSMSNYRPGHNYNYIRTLQFKMIINSNDFNTVKSKEIDSHLDLVNKQLKTTPPKSQAETIFSIDGKDYLGYYNPDKNVFSVMEISAGH